MWKPEGRAGVMVRHMRSSPLLSTRVFVRSGTLAYGAIRRVATLQGRLTLCEIRVLGYRTSSGDGYSCSRLMVGRTAELGTQASSGCLDAMSAKRETSSSRDGPLGNAGCFWVQDLADLKSACRGFSSAPGNESAKPDARLVRLPSAIANRRRAERLPRRSRTAASPRCSRDGRHPFMLVRLFGGSQSCPLTSSHN